MKYVVFGVVVATLMALPSASAATTIEVELYLPEVGHETHPAVIPPSGRLEIPIGARLHTNDLVCAQPATFNVNIIMTAEDIANYGASPNPDQTSFVIPAGQPGAGPKSYETPSEDWMSLGVFWNAEARPATGAKQTYTIDVDTSKVGPDGGPCLPGADPTANQLLVYTVGEDIPTGPNATTGVNCAALPDDPACLDPVTETPVADSPSVAGFVMFAGVAVALLLRRRRA